MIRGLFDFFQGFVDVFPTGGIGALFYLLITSGFIGFVFLVFRFIKSFNVFN